MMPQSGDMQQIWTLLRKLRGDPDNIIVIQKLTQLATAAKSERVRDYVSSAIFKINGIIIYPFGCSPDGIRYLRRLSIYILSTVGHAGGMIT